MHADVELVGRDDDLRRIAAFVEQSASSGGALLLGGEPGVGKTAVLDEVASRAASAGSRVLRAAGAQFEADLSFAGLHQVVHQLLAEMAALSDSHASALQAAVGLSEGNAADRLVVGHATLALLVAAAEHQPLLLVVDDLPWMDRSSAMVLGFVARRLRGYKVGFTLCCGCATSAAAANSGSRSTEPS
jgi:predicted ATPase